MSNVPIMVVPRILLAALIAATLGPSGASASGAPGDGGPAVAAAIEPVSIALTPAGTLVIADLAHHRLREVDANGIITTRAGTGGTGHGGEGSDARSVAVDAERVAIGSDGRIFVKACDGLSRTHDGGVTCPAARLKVIEPNDTLRTIAGAGTTYALGTPMRAADAAFVLVEEIEVDREGNVLVADFGEPQCAPCQGTNGRIHRITPGGDLTSPLQELGDPRGIGVGGLGQLWVSEWFASSISECFELPVGQRCFARASYGCLVLFCVDGTAYHGPEALAVGDDRVVWVEHSGDGVVARVRAVDALGRVTTIAGGNGCVVGYTGSDASKRCIGMPTDVVVAPDGAVLVADLGARVVWRIQAGTITVIAGSGA